MQYRDYKNTGLKTSLLGMGNMRLPRLPGQGEAIDYEKAEAILDYAYAHGVNYFDTAYMYHGGESESVVGRILSKYPRDSYFLVTKMPGFLCENETQVRQIFQTQLERCGVDYFDFYLCHSVSDENIERYMAGYIIPVLEEMLEKGKIRRLGFSFHGTPETLERFVAVRDWDFAQIQMNYLDWTYQNAKRQYDILTERGIPVVVMEPVRGGRLASLLPETDAVMKNFAPQRSIASWAVRWVCSHENVQVMLSGMSTMEQVVDNVQTVSELEPISEKEQEIIDGAVSALLDKSLLPCTGCRYCIECPQGLDIPSLIEIYNDYSLSGNPMELGALRELPEDKQPGACIGCGQCHSICPQSIDVPAAMAHLAEAAKTIPAPPPIEMP